MAQMITRAEKKRRIWTIVIGIFFGLLGVGLGTWAMIKMGDIEQKNPEIDNDIPELTEELEEAIQLRRQYETLIAAWSDLFRSHHGANDTQDKQLATPVNNDAIKSLLDLYGPEMKRSFEKDEGYEPYFKVEEKPVRYWIPRRAVRVEDPEDPEAFPEKWTYDFRGGKWEVIDENFKEPVRVPNQPKNPLWLTTIVRRAIEQIRGYKAAVKKYDAETMKAWDEMHTKLKKLREQNDERVKEIPPVVKQLEELLRNFAAQEENQFQEIAGLEKQLGKERRDLHDLLARQEEEITRLNKTLEDYRSRIRWMKHWIQEEEERKEPDGTVLHVNPEDGIVRVSLTRHDKLFQFMTFRVFGFTTGNRRVEKGIVTIVEPRDDLSIAVIDRVFNEKEFPIQPGDRIWNIRYKKDETKHFVIAGKLTEYSRSEIAQKLMELGDVLQDEINKYTRFCIVGAGYENDPIYKEAKAKGIRLYAERHLYDYCGLPHKH